MYVFNGFQYTLCIIQYIMERKSLGENCNIVDLDDARLLGIEIEIGRAHV